MVKILYINTFTKQPDPQKADYRDKTEADGKIGRSKHRQNTRTKRNLTNPKHFVWNIHERRWVYQNGRNS